MYITNLQNIFLKEKYQYCINYMKSCNMSLYMIVACTAL